MYIYNVQCNNKDYMKRLYKHTVLALLYSQAFNWWWLLILITIYGSLYNIINNQFGYLQSKYRDDQVSRMDTSTWLC